MPEQEKARNSEVEPYRKAERMLTSLSYRFFSNLSITLMLLEGVASGKG
jgi:hypothetical protein